MLLCGDFHQGSEIFPVRSRGKQCLANCLVFHTLSSFKYINTWSKNDLNSVLKCGDKLYNQLISTMVDTEILHPSEFPQYISLENRYFSFKIQETFHGSLNESFEDFRLQSLESCIHTLLLTDQTKLLFIALEYGMALSKMGDVICFFDSHSRNENGHCVENGHCIVLTLPLNKGQICVFLRSVFQSLSSRPLSEIQFDCHFIRLKEITPAYFFRLPSYKKIDIGKICESFENIVEKTYERTCINIESGSKDYIRSRRKRSYPTCQSSIDHASCIEIQEVNSCENNNDSEEVLLKNKKRKVSLKNVITKDIEGLISEFKTAVSQGPEFVCCSCMQTWFRHSVCNADMCLLQKINTDRDKNLLNLQNFNVEKSWLCNFCKISLKQGNIPILSPSNGLQFPPKPPELDLTQLEERLVAPRIPFMQMFEKCRGGQFAVKGNVVNVPVDVDKTVRILPRTLDDDETIPLKLKRKKSYDNHVSFEMIRPNRVFIAAKYLVENSQIFKNEGITVNESWLENCLLDKHDEVEATKSTSNPTAEVEAPENSTSIQLKDKEIEEWSEVDIDEKVEGNIDTVLHPTDFREFNQILTVAPGEGNFPLSLYEDKYAEFLAFPTVYAGTIREDNNCRVNPLHYSQIVKWELRNIDRRVATNIPLIFFKMKKLQIKAIKDKVTMAIRKFKKKGKKVTVEDILEPGGFDKLVKLDEGFRVLRTIRGSPPYWEQAKKDIFAMIRQLGLPTFFCSFSAAETKWTPLLQTLSKLLLKKEMTENEVINLSWEQKCHLIKSDPVTCVRYFDNRVQKFIGMVLKSTVQPIGEITDFFYRVEFQQRGSPHIHMLAWIANAPIFNPDINNFDDITTFVDRYISCKNDGARSDLINYQTHRHAKTCRKKGKPICRFGFPLPPMPKTMVLLPLDYKDKEYERAKQNLQKVNEILESLKRGNFESSSFQEFLMKVGLNFESYVLALRSGLKSPKIVLKRDVSEIRINSYNSVLLESWEANMDIQFILDAYACVSYIVSYISKGQRGMSNLLSDACNEAKSKESTIRDQVRIIGNKFLNHVEIGAQEAVYLLLQIPLRKSSRAVKFIHTSPPEERTVILKPTEVLKTMPKSSTNIESDSLLKQYSRRPKILDNFCLADYVAWFELKYPQKFEKNDETEDGNVDFNDKGKASDDAVVVEVVDTEKDNSQLTEWDNDLLDKIPKYIELKNGSKLVMRKFRKVVRYVRYNIEADRENYFREQLMLFLPWRSEDKDLLSGCATYEENYCKMKNLIDKRKINYELNGNVSLDDYINNVDIDPFELSGVDPSCSNAESDLDTVNCKNTCDPAMYGCFDPLDPVLHETYDIGVDLGIKRTHVGNIQESVILPDSLYREKICALNEEQKKFFYHVLHWFKVHEDKPLYVFLSGGAGVGKSVLTRAMYQSLHRYFSHKVGECPDDISILLCAPTGKAAHNIGGNTIHSAFHIPANQGFSFKPLDTQQLNSLRCRYSKLKCVFIDEISMVGNKMFNFINLRLQEIKGSTSPFGGISIVAIGDLFQLKPVMDNWIFCNLQLNYGPLGTNLWNELFCMYELKVIMRQKEDKLFAEVLNRLREGIHTGEDIQLIKHRKIYDAANYESIPHLFTTRKEVASFNEKVFLQTENRKCVVNAIDTISGDVATYLVEKIVAKIPNDSSKTMGLEKELCIAEHTPAELCVNLDVEDGLTNGASCVIKKIDYRVEKSRRCSILWVQFEDESVGRKWRNQFKHLFKPGISTLWVPILEVTRKFILQYYKSYQIIRRQFPLHMACAKTIHKSQGSTMTSAVIDFGKRKTEHIHYVALSRVQHLSKIYILDLNEEKIETSKDVSEEMLRLREKGFQFIVPNIVDEKDSQSLSICFHNTRSLHLHFHDLQFEYQLKKVDILALSETRLKNSDLDIDYQLDNFTIHRFDSKEKAENSIRPTHGMVVYCKSHLQVNECYSRSLMGIDIVTVSLITTKPVCFHFVYCPPKFATKDRLMTIFTAICEETDLKSPAFVIGDFNVDIRTQTYLSEFALQKGLFQLISSSTTDYDTILDHIYTNVDLNNLVYGTLECYYSDHKPIFVQAHLH